MKNALLFSIFFLGLSTTACKKTFTESIANKNAVGQYTFEKVTRSDGFLNRKDITNEYNNIVLQLNDKNEAALINNETGVTYIGNWHITETYTTNYSYDDDDGGGSNSTANYTLTIHVSESARRSLNFYGKNATIRRHKIRFQEQKGDGKYRYKLNKL